MNLFVSRLTFVLCVDGNNFLSLSSFALRIICPHILQIILPSEKQLLNSCLQLFLNRYDWLINNRWFGRCIRDYREGRGIPKRLKVFTLLLLWVTIGCSAAFAVDSLLIRIILALIAVGVTAHILSIQTAKVERNPSGSLSGFHINSAGPDHLRQASTVEGEKDREPGRGY